MGTQLTKIGQTIGKEPETASLPSTPILTPKIKVLDLDPRSPTANIIRTPIQVKHVFNFYNAQIVHIVYKNKIV